MDEIYLGSLSFCDGGPKVVEAGARLLKQKIVYFTMEIALSNDIHTFSGDLGILAGDVIRSSADLNILLVAVALISRKGYFL